VRGAMGETDRVPAGGRAMSVIDVSAGERSSESGVQHFEPPLASQVLLGIKQLEPNGQVLLRRPDCVRGHSGPPGVGGLPSAY
jgi:hypothetical protein